MPPFAALVVAWATNAFWPLLGRDGLSFYSAPLFFYGGLAVALAAVGPWLLPGRRWRRVVHAEVAWPLALMGLLSGTASIIYLAALHFTTPANAAVMAQVEVLYSALLSAWLLREPVPAAQVWASALVVAGTGLIMAHDLGSWRWKGDLMILGTPWLYQVSHVVAKRLPKDLDPLQVTGSRLFYGLLVLAPVALWSLHHGARWSWSGPALRLLVLQGLFMSGLALLMWYQAILRMDLAKATAFLLSYPALTMLLSWALGRESIHPIQVTGLAVTLLGALWLSRLTLAAGSAARRRPGALPAPATDPEGPGLALTQG